MNNEMQDMVEAQEMTYNGIQKGMGSDIFVCFSDPLTGTTMLLSAKDLCPEKIKDMVDQSRGRFEKCSNTR